LTTTLGLFIVQEKLEKTVTESRKGEALNAIIPTIYGTHLFVNVVVQSCQNEICYMQ
jgi:hypothetical protein